MTRILFAILAGVFGCHIWAVPSAAEPSCDKSFAQVFREISPSVVRVFSVSIDPFSLRERVQLGIGSGLVIDDHGHIVTNAHVVHGASVVMVSLGDGGKLVAEVVGMDPIADLAVVKLSQGNPPLPKAPFRHSATLEVGTPVLAIGYPFGMGMTATQGIVSGIERVIRISPMSWLTPMIQTDAAVSPGNSGGPLANLCGEVIGINTLTGESGQGINFAVPIEIAGEIVPQLLTHGRVIRAWHGIHGRVVPAILGLTFGVAPGFLVETIEPGSPAQQIGLRGGSFPVVIGAEEFLLGGDVIATVNGEALSDMRTVVRIVRSLEVGDKVTLEYWRDGQLKTAEATLPERPTLPGDVRRFRRN